MQKNVKCSNLKIKNKKKLLDRFTNLSFKTRNKIGSPYDSKVFENTSFLNSLNSKNNALTRNSQLSTMTDYIYTNKNQEAILCRKPIRAKFFEQFNNQNFLFKTYSNSKSIIYHKPFMTNEYNYSYTNIIPSLSKSNTNINSFKKNNNKTLSNSLKLLKTNSSIIQTDNNKKKYYLHSLLNLNSNTGTYSFSTTERNMRYQPNISFGKLDIFMNYVKSKEHLSYFKNYLNSLLFECKHDEKQKQILIYKLYLERMYKLFKIYFKTNDKYLIKLKVIIDEENEKNNNISKLILQLKQDILSLTSEKYRYLSDINLYKDVKNFLHKIRNYILSNTEKKLKEDKITPVRKLFITEQGEFNDENYLELLAPVLKQKFVDDYSRIELPYRDYLIFDNMIKDRIAKLLIQQANIIKEQEPMKEEFNMEVQNFEISEKKYNEFYNREYKKINKKIIQLKKENKFLNKNLANLKNKYLNNIKISNNNIENKIMNIYDFLVNEKIIDEENGENSEKYNEKYFGKKKIFSRLDCIDKTLVYLIDEKKYYLKEKPEKYKEEEKKLNEKKKLQSVLNAKIKEIKEKKLKEKKLYDSLSKIHFKGIKKDYLSINIPDNLKNKFKKKHKIKNKSIDLSF